MGNFLIFEKNQHLEEPQINDEMLTINNDFVDNKNSQHFIINIFKVIFILLLFIIIFIKANEIIIVEEWEKYSNNPVLGNKVTGTLFDPYIIIGKDGSYKMYVSWRKYGAIALTSSINGINWSDLKIVLNKGKDWENIVNRACVIFKDGIYHMWSTGQYKDQSKIGYAKSDDGINFVKLGNTVLIPEYKYEQNSVMNPHVIYDEQENLYKMWYAGGETYEPDVIGYATSKDGIKWDKYKDNPILEKREKKIYLDYYKVGACDVHKLSNNYYLMFYIGYSDLHTARIFVAYSKNGIDNWKRSFNPIIKPENNKFDGKACYKPSAIYNIKDNKWMLWYNGRNYNKEFIGLAFHNDSKIFKNI